MKYLNNAFTLSLLAAILSGCIVSKIETKPPSLAPPLPPLPPKSVVVRQPVAQRPVQLAVIIPKPTISTQVAWDFATDSMVTGYAVSYGTNPNALTNKVYAGNHNLCTLSNLEPSTLYYIAVANMLGVTETAQSQPIMFLPPGTLMMTLTNQTATLRFLPVSNLTLAASPDLTHWTNIFSTNDSQHVVEFREAAVSKRFYRLIKQ
jgi:hypothetical protein